MITRCLSELLYDHECVIVPELGALISKECSASVDYTNHRFTPPCKEIVFNRQLLNDDNLLLNYIIDKEGVNEDEAKQAIHDFAMQTMAVLESGFAAKLDGIGELMYNSNHDIVLRSDEEANFLSDSFGLTSFTAQPIYRSENYQVIKEKIAVQNFEKNTQLSLAIEKVDDTEQVKVRKSYKWIRPMTYISLICLLFLLLGWGTQESSSNLAGWIPLFYSSPNEFIITHLSREMMTESIVVEPNPTIEEVKTTTDFVDDEVVESVIKENEIVEPEIIEPEIVEPIVSEPIVAQVEEVPAVNHYFIIGGSFQKENRAEVCLNDMKNKGFDNSIILDCNEKGYWRVAYEAYPEKETALSRLSTIKSDVNEAAWLLFQK